MSEWFADLPVVWMALLVFGITYIVTASIYAAVVAVATPRRASVFKAVSPGMLSPLGILFALFVAFTASEVWGNIERANTADETARITSLQLAFDLDQGLVGGDVELALFQRADVR